MDETPQPTETPAEEMASEEPVEAPEEVEAAPVEVHEQKQELPKKLTDQPKYVGAPVPGRLDRLKSFIVECKRVLRVTKKPDRQEFITIVKISAIGIGIIGLIGFIVHLAQQLLF